MKIGLISKNTHLKLNWGKYLFTPHRKTIPFATLIKPDIPLRPINIFTLTILNSSQESFLAVPPFISIQSNDTCAPLLSISLSVSLAGSDPARDSILDPGGHSETGKAGDGALFRPESVLHYGEDPEIGRGGKELRKARRGGTGKEGTHREARE